MADQPDSGGRTTPDGSGEVDADRSGAVTEPDTSGGAVADGDNGTDGADGGNGVDDGAGTSMVNGDGSSSGAAEAGVPAGDFEGGLGEGSDSEGDLWQARLRESSVPTQRDHTVDNGPEVTPERASGPVGTRHTHGFSPWREWPITAVLTAVALSLLLVVLVDFRVGAVSLACSVLMAAALRAGVPVRRAGLLVLRSRWLDVLVLLLLGGGALALAIVVPDAN